MRCRGQCNMSWALNGAIDTDLIHLNLHMWYSYPQVYMALYHHINYLLLSTSVRDIRLSKPKSATSYISAESRQLVKLRTSMVVLTRQLDFLMYFSGLQARKVKNFIKKEKGLSCSFFLCLYALSLSVVLF